MAHDHSHGEHDHGHSGHGHGHGAHSHAHGANESRLFWASLITGGFMFVEAVGGLFAGSLALLADAGHMLTDFAGLFMAWLAFRFSRWPADGKRTYGFERLQVLVAFGNGLALFAIAAAIIVEAARRFADPQPVLGGAMLVIAAIGLAVNIGVFLVLHGADRENLNVRGAMLHVLGDLLGSVGAIAAALVILGTGWTAADPIISVVVAVIILRSAWFVVRDSAHILLEAAPGGVSPEAIAADLTETVADVEDVHHVHAWSLTQERPMVTLHARICEDGDADRAMMALKTRLSERFGINHATIEIERGPCLDRDCGEFAAHHSHDKEHAHAH